MGTLVDKHNYLWPVELAVSKSPLRRVLVVGTCRDTAWARACSGSHIDVPADNELFYHTRVLPACPPSPVTDYDFQLLLPPLRRVLPEASYFRLPYGELGPYQELFAECKERLEQYLNSMLRYNIEHGLLTFVSNFLVPQQNPLGRLMPRYDLRNLIYFIEKLNEYLSDLISGYQNVYLLDFDSIVSIYGRRTCQNDVVWATNDGGTISNFDFDQDQQRLEEVSRLSDIYPAETYDYILYAWHELFAMYRTIRQIDPVKLVVIDLDDTLWRGIAVERSDNFYESMEGWPTGFIEALTWLKRRGILLAIISKNNSEQVISVWNKLIDENRLSISDFAITRINWRPKAENLEEILAILNLLPRNVLFVDDNPVERASIKSAFPDVRTIGSNPYLWRRILLWAPETQVAAVTVESSTRTEMVKAQVEREGQRRRMSREDFLNTLSVEVSIDMIDSVDANGFKRALELLNKSNQFNTTGKRWTLEEFNRHFIEGGRLLTFDVKDNYTSYGSVGCVVMMHAHVAQFVMSCRVVGLEVEITTMAYIIKLLAAERIDSVTAELIKTDSNRLCQDLFSQCGFTEEWATCRWVRPTLPPLMFPRHIAIRDVP